MYSVVYRIAFEVFKDGVIVWLITHVDDVWYLIR